MNRNSISTISRGIEKYYLFRGFGPTNHFTSSQGKNLVYLLAKNHSGVRGTGTAPLYPGWSGNTNRCPPEKRAGREIDEILLKNLINCHNAANTKPGDPQPACFH